MATQILLDVTSSYSILSAVVVHKKELTILNIQIGVIEDSLNQALSKNIPYRSKLLSCQVAAIIGFALWCIIFDASWITVRIIISGPLILWYINVIIISILIIQIYLYSTCIGYLFRRLNHMMQWQMSKKTYVLKGGLMFFLKAHEEISELIFLVNEIFGFKIFLLISNIILNIIVCADRLINFSVKQIKIDKDVLIIISSSLFMILFVAFGAILSISCDKTASEARRTSLISYKILMNYPSCPRTTREKIIKEELILLAEHISRRKVHFSAGIFTVDYSMLFMIFGSIATYLVIILQFK
ncbi:putative gustatory receptor 2a [Anoplophora glabripennis]|uniref:putative gustatory receptor 2a n=1 Tax=Anoplophora glabripennis TaxID=217634 RepID=UPI000874F64C|nr:putative gustatory receptor 2a [Anoplophora glabripennis]